MKLKEPLKVSDIAKLINATIIGDGNAMVTGINEIHKVQEGDITYVDFHKYYNF